MNRNVPELQDEWLITKDLIIHVLDEVFSELRVCSNTKNTKHPNYQYDLFTLFAESLECRPANNGVATL